MRALALAGNGELLIGGDFTSVGGAGRNRLARLNSGGALQTFLSAVGEGADNFVTGLLVSNGKIVVAGAFGTVNGQGRAGLVRLNDDGTLDASINFGSGANAQVNALGVQADGRLVAAGAFTSFNGTVAGRLVRLDGGLNSDSGTFTFSSATYTATESAGSVGLAIVRSGGLNNSPVISYSVSSGAGNIASLTPATSITFAAGQVSSNLTVNLLPDNTTVQADRTAVITLSSAGTGTLGTPISATLTIQDDDSVIGFAQTGYTVSEGGGTASITVARLGGVAGTVQVDYATVAETGFGKATVVSDYTGVNNTLTFTSGVTNLAFTIPIIQDALTEGNETVTLALFNARPQVVGGASATLATANNQGVALGVSGTVHTNATLTILDDESAPGTLGFELAAYSVNEEAGSLTVNVQRSAGSAGTVTVQYNTANGTALHGSDYTGATNPLTFANGEIVKSFTVAITPDTLVEGNETFTLQLSSLTGGALPGIVSATVTIVDNDSTVAFTQSAYLVGETNGSITITARRTGGTNGLISAFYSTTNATATAGSDYTAIPGGQSQPVTSVSGTTLTLNNHGLTNGNPVVFGGSPANGLASDVAYAVTNAAQNTFQVLSNGALVPVSGAITTLTVRPGLVWASGDAADKPFIVSVTEDLVVEGAETFTVHLVAGSGAVVVTTPAAVVTILDNDGTGGTLESGFALGAGPDNAVNASAVQPDAKVVVVGTFASYNGTARGRVLRLNVDGTLDPTFLNVGAGADAAVNAVALDANANPLFSANVGKVVIGGSFTTVNGTARSRVARLNADGTLDLTFTPPAVGGPVLAVAVQADGKVLLAGSFTVSARQNVVRLNADGTLDPTFLSGLVGANATVQALLVQADGKLVLGGDFTSVNGASANRLARLNPDGTLDASFNVGAGANATVRTLAFDGTSIVAGGDFTGPSFGAAVTNKALTGSVATLTTSGNHLFAPGDVLTISLGDATFDGTFTLASASGNTLTYNKPVADVASAAVSPTGLAGLAVRPVNRLARLTSSGTLDTAFSDRIGTGPNGGVTTVARLATGGFLLGGSFSGPGFGAAVTNLSQTTTTVTLQAAVSHGLVVGDVVTVSGVGSAFDGTYVVSGVDAPNRKFNFTVSASATTADTLVAPAGSATRANQVHNRIAQLTSAGAVDTALGFGSAFDSSVNTLSLQTVGATTYYVVGGAFASYNGISGSGYDFLVRLNAGTADRTFNQGAGVDATVNAVALNPAGQLVIGGLFTNVNGVARGRVARFNVDGTLDLAFAPAALLPVGTVINGVAVDRNTNTFLSANVGKVVIGGTFTNAGATLRGRIARLNPDGTLDITFQNGLAGADNTVDAVAVQSDGKVLLVGAFSSVNGVARGGIARLNADGTLDTGFMNGLSGADAEVRAVLVDEAAVTVPAGGYLYVAGDFSSLNGTSRSKVARLFLASGALDTGFVPPTAVNGAVRALALAGNGELLIGGDFTSVGASPRNRLARLNSGGALQAFLDATSVTSNGADYFVTALLVNNGKILVAGAFATVNGQGRAGLARLNDAGTLDATINFGTGANGYVNALAVQSDGRLVAGGAFTSFNGTPAGGIVRLDGGLNTDLGTFNFSSATYTTTESAGTVAVIVNRAGGLNGVASVNFTLVPTLTTTPSSSLAFVDGQASSAFIVTLPANDNVPEADVTVALSLPVQPGVAVVRTATLTIRDDDSALSFAQAGYTVSEGGGSATITVVRTGGIAGTVQVDYSTVAGGSATPGVDYQLASGTLTYTDGVTNQTFSVAILPDGSVEGNETIALSLTNAFGLGPVGAVLGPLVVATLTIVDDDFSPGQIAFSALAYTVAETNSSQVITVIRTNGTQNSVSVNFTTANGTASSGSDYVATSGLLTWSPGDSASKTFVVTILNDTAVEGDETINLALSGATGGAQITGGSAVLTIQDDDDLVQFAATAVSFFESASNAVLTVQRVGGGYGLVTVNYATVDGTARAGIDYTTNSGTLTFDTNVYTQTIVVPIANDQATNVAKTFSVQLGQSVGASLPGASSAVQVTILDDDSQLQFATNAVSVSEGLGSITLTVTRTGFLTNVVAVQFATTSGTATNSTDFVPISGVLTFGTNVTNSTITVTLLNDAIAELDENFTVVLTAPTGEASLGAYATNTVTILNDDSIVQFAIGTYSVVESVGSVTLNVVRTGPSNNLVTVPFTSASVTAFAGTDFVATNGTVRFETNVVSTNIVVTILNDKLVESGETFTVTLGAPIGESTLGPTNSATITIVDDESTLEFVVSSVSVLESSGVLSVQASRVGALNSAVTLPFNFINGAATNGLDFLGTNGTLTFGSGVSQQSFNVGIANDVIVEGPKTFSILLGTPGGEAVLGTRTVMNVTILDDDSVVQFPSGTLNVSESAQSGTITVQRTGATNVAVSVNLSTADGLAATATAGVDYGAVTTNLVFGIGESQKSFTVPLINDSIVEGTEAFRVLINSVTGQATIGAISNLTVSITDDDFRTLIPAGYALIAEGYQPTNNAVDPLETVTMNFSIQNIGNVTSPDITATLLLSGGVMSPSAPQVYTNLTNGALRTMPFTFAAAQVQTLTATLQLQDINGPVGALTFSIDLGVPNSFSNRTRINIPGTITVPSFGPASPYTNQITVTNVTGLVNKVTVRLQGFQHTWPADVDMLLVGPAGQKVVLMSDAGSGISVANLNLTFDDAASSTLPELTTILDGTFRPTDYAPGDSFPAPAPAGPYATNLSVFNGTSPNGVWTLYIVDDTDQNNGTILSGWSLNLSTVSPLVNLAATMTNSAATVIAPGQVTFTTTITNRGPNTATGVIYSNTLPVGLTYISATNSAGSNLTVTAGRVVGNLGALATGAVHTVTVTVSTGGAGLFTNTAVVFSAGVEDVELVPADNSASSVVAVTTGVLSLTGQSLGGGNISFTLSNSVPGRTYVFEGTTNFLTPTASTVWTPFTTNDAVGSTLSVTNADVGGFLRRFYRAIER